MHPDQRLPDSEMEAILGVLKGNNGAEPDGEAVDRVQLIESPVRESAEEG